MKSCKTHEKSNKKIKKAISFLSLNLVSGTPEVAWDKARIKKILGWYLLNKDDKGADFETT